MLCDRLLAAMFEKKLVHQFANGAFLGMNDQLFVLPLIPVAGAVSFNQWQTSHFTAAQIGDPSISGFLGTPQMDGVPNLLKYAFDINPSEPMSAVDRAALPAVGRQSINNLTYLTLTYRESSSATGITVNLQKSSTLQSGSWITVAPDILFESAPNLISGDIIVTDMVNVTGQSPEFLRLDVTSP